MGRPRVIVQVFVGLGDTIYQRPFIRALAKRADVWVVTPWPELFSDLPVGLLPSDGKRLRTQALNVERQPASIWSTPPKGADVLHLGYWPEDLERGNLLEAFERTIPLQGEPLALDLPPLPPSPVSGRYAVVRPVTLRREWFNSARNPLPAYVERAAVMLRQLGLQVVTIAHLDGEVEWMEGVVPADVRFEGGQLAIPELLALIAGAEVVVGGVGYVLPAALAARANLVVIAGGHGAHNAPEVVTDPRLDTSRLRWIVPDNYCRCSDMKHACDKTVSAFRPKLLGALYELGLCG